jgi:predicted nucleic acid-binding protein
MVFIDTGAFLARFLSGDSHHRAVMKSWKRLPGRPLFTSNHVVDETLTLLGRRAGYQFAADQADAIYGSQALEILYSGPEEERDAVELLRKFADQRVSFTDCVSFVLMKRRRIRTAFTLDRHFLAAGFEVM